MTSIARWAILFISLKLIILMINENPKMRLWFYYTNVYYKYIHGSFNIDNETYCYFKNNIT